MAPRRTATPRKARVPFLRGRAPASAPPRRRRTCSPASHARRTLSRERKVHRRAYARSPMCSQPVRPGGHGGISRYTGSIWASSRLKIAVARIAAQSSGRVAIKNLLGGARRQRRDVAGRKQARQAVFEKIIAEALAPQDHGEVKRPVKHGIGWVGALRHVHWYRVYAAVHSEVQLASRAVSLSAWSIAGALWRCVSRAQTRRRA